MRKWRLFRSGFPAGGKSTLLYVIIVTALLYLSVCENDARADDVSVEVVENGIFQDNLVMQFQAEGVFTERVIKFLTRGFTVRIEYTIELWRSRRWWFDHLDHQININYEIDFEPLGKRYTFRTSRPGKEVTSKLDQQLANIIQWTTQPELPIVIVPAVQLDLKSGYYYNLVVSIATLTAEDINDLRRWIKVGGKEKETSTLTKTSFKLAKDAISARHRKRVSIQSEKFRLRDLPRFDG